MIRPVLDREITVQQKSVTQEATFGTEVVTWVALSYLPGSPLVAERFPAEIQDVLPSRAEDVQQGVVIGSTRTRCRIRWRDDVTSAMRAIVHGDTDSYWKITTPPVEYGGRKQYIEFMMERHTSDG